MFKYCEAPDYDSLSLLILSIVPLDSSSESDESSFYSFPSGNAKAIKLSYCGMSLESLFFIFSFLKGDFANICLPSERIGSI